MRSVYIHQSLHGELQESWKEGPGAPQGVVHRFFAMADLLLRKEVKGLCAHLIFEVYVIISILFALTWKYSTRAMLKTAHGSLSRVSLESMYVCWGVEGVKGKVRAGSEERLRSKGARLGVGIWGFWVPGSMVLRSTLQLSSVCTCDWREGAMLRPSPLSECSPR